MRALGASRTSVATGGILGANWARNPLWKNARAVPSLDLRFAENKSLTNAKTGASLVTFTRASSSTYVGSDGLIKTAVTNLSLRSQELGDAAWTKTLSSITADATIAPNGTTTADKLVEDSSTGAHNIAEAAAITYTSGLAYTFSFFIKKAERQTVQILTHPNPFPGTVAQRTAIFNSNTGAFVSVGSAYTGSSVTAFSDGWYRVSVSSTSDATATGNFTITLCSDDIGTSSYTGNGTSGLFLWGAQLEQASTVGEYIPTTSTINSAPRFDHNPTTGESLGLLVEDARTNLLLRSEELDNASWTKTDCTITANESTAPDGTTTADLWTNIASPGVISNSITKDTTARTYTSSLWVKGTLTQFTVSLDDGTTVNRGRVQFNLSNNTVGSIFNDGTFTSTSGTLTQFLNGWVRVTVTTTTSSGITIRLRPFFSGATSTLRVWGAQVEEGAFVTSYIPTTTATATRAADVASITGSNFGITRTNYIRNNTMVGAVVGTPGTLPTNWSVAGSAALSTQVVGTGTDSGINYIDIRCFGTTAAVASPEIYFNFDVVTAISVAQNQTWTTSCYAKIVGGTQTGIVGGELYILGLNISSGLTEAAPENFNYSSLTGTFSTCRVSKTHTFTVATTVYSQQRIDVNFTPGGGTVVDFTLRIGMCQMELGSVATAAIPTTTAAVSVFESSWYNQTEGTVFADNTNYAVSNARIVSFSDNSTSNRFIVGRGTGSSGNINFFVAVGGVTQVSSLILASSLSFGLAAKVAVAVKASDFAGSANGLAPVTQATGSMTTALSQLTIGNGETLGLNMFSGTIKRLTYWPVRLATPTLVSITQP